MNAQLSNSKIGIIGAGHLGLTLATAFIRSFLPKSNLLITHAGSPKTVQTLYNEGLSPNVAGNEEVCTTADIVFIFIRPQNFKEFKKIPVSKDTLFVSGMAGIPIAALRADFGDNICRIMTSGPATILSGKAIVALYPANATVWEIMSKAGLTPYLLENEENLHYFTVGVCLPAALVLANERRIDVEDAIAAFCIQLPLFREIYRWAQTIIPDFQSKKAADEYVRKMATPGGVTEAIVTSFEKNTNFLEALEAGTERSMTIAAGYV